MPESSEAIRRRATLGVLLLSARTAVIRVFGLLTTIVLARLLVPEDFGVVAIALLVLGNGNLLAEAGLGLALVRRPEPPSRVELKAVAAFQVGVGLAFLIVAAALAPLFGTTGYVTALMLTCMPLGALRTPAFVLLERELDYRKRVRVEIGEQLMYTVLVLVLAIAGAGVWAIVISTVAKTLFGLVLAAQVVPGAMVVPRWHRPSVQPLLGFGAQFQLTSVLHRVLEITLFAIIGAFGGLEVLGFVALAGRLMQIPNVALDAIWTVSVPAYARLSEQGEDLGHMARRSVVVVGLPLGLALSLLAVASVGLLEPVFGPEWGPASDVLVGSCIAYSLGVPINMAILPALIAAGDARTNLLATLVHAPIRLAATAGGLLLFGPWTIGAAWVLAHGFETVLVARRAGRSLQTHFARPLLCVLAATSGGTLAGVGVSVSAGSTPIASFLGFATCLTAFALLVRIVDRDAAREARSTIARAVRGARSGPKPPMRPVAERG